jgi:iron-sulfur cluster assembly protein CyaY
VPVVTELSEKEFRDRAFPELAALIAALDELPELTAELSGDVLTIEFEDQKVYVLNSHLAARQIWLAAERSAWHFDYAADQDRWVEKKSSSELWPTLERMLQAKLGRPVALTRTVPSPDA